MNMENSGDTFSVSRVCNVSKEKVYKAWTEKDQLVKWWGPKGLKISHAEINLVPGGVFHYCMESPEGFKMWGKFVFSEIVPNEKLVFVVSFCDEQQNFVRHPMAPTWPYEVLNILTLQEQDDKTLLTIKGWPINATEIESATYFGAKAAMEMGFNGTFSQLEDFLKD